MGIKHQGWRAGDARRELGPDVLVEGGAVENQARLSSVLLSPGDNLRTSLLASGEQSSWVGSVGCRRRCVTSHIVPFDLGTLRA